MRSSRKIFRLCNLGSLNSYAQTCLKDFNLKGPVSACHYVVYWPTETPDGYEFRYSSANLRIPNTSLFPFKIWTNRDDYIYFDKFGLITKIDTYDTDKMRPEVQFRTEYVYKNDKLDRVTRSNVISDIDGPSILLRLTIIMISLK